MNLYYFACDCKPTQDGASNGMMADVYILESGKSAAEVRVKEHLLEHGWELQRVDHFEIVNGVPVHDSRLSELCKKAKQEGIASLFSPY